MEFTATKDTVWYQEGQNKSLATQGTNGQVTTDKVYRHEGNFYSNKRHRLTSQGVHFDVKRGNVLFLVG